MTEQTQMADVAVAAANAGGELQARTGAAGVVKRGNAYSIDPRTITRTADWNPRFEFGDLHGLAASIDANGILNAIRVKRLAKDDPRRDQKPHGVPLEFELIDGERRFGAVELLLKKGRPFADGIPTIIVDIKQDDVTSLIQMFEANTGKQFLPLEEAAAYKRMQDAGMTLKQIEKATGRSDNSIVGALALLTADPTLVDAVKGGKIGATMAKSIAVNARGDKAKQAALTQQAVDAGKDKTKKDAVKKAVDDSRRAKAAKIGKKLKIRALSNKELSDIGMGLAAALAAALEGLGMPMDSDLRQWLKDDNTAELGIAFTFGALEGLKAAAGVKVDFTV